MALHGQGLLILSRDAGIEAGANHSGGLLPLAKNLPGFLMPDPCFTGISRSSPRMAADYPFRPCGIHHNSMRDREDGRSVPESRR